MFMAYRLWWRRELKIASPTRILRSCPLLYSHTKLLSIGDRAPNRDGGSPRAFACVELKWPCDGSSGWGVPTSGVSSNLLRNDVPGSRIKVHRQHSRMPPTKWVSPVTLTKPGRGASNDICGADLYQTSASTESPAKPDRVDLHRQNPQQSHHLTPR
jgi:hypothetical protein